ncbi:EpsG family protein [Pseudomonas guariconensis]|uniref:EpsG family protein n=1 Tax=Pseudomonas guariconensis TaxID=1288410 RepID=UPI003F6DFBAA
MVSSISTRNRVWLALLTLMLLILAGIRSPEVSDDYVNYVNYYNLMVSADSFSLGLPVEPAFYVLSKIGELLSAGHIFLFLCFAALGVGIKAYVFRRYANLPLLSLLVYFSFYYFQFEFAHIRAGVAVAILYLYFFKSLEHENPYLIMVGVALAMTFHYSSIFFTVSLVPYWLSRSRFSFVSIIFYLVVSAALIGLFYLGVGLKDLVINLAEFDFTGKLSYYVQGLDYGVLNNINIFNRLALHLAAFFFLLLGYSRIKNLGYIALVHLHGLGIVFFCIFAQIPVLAYRLSDIFLFSSVFTVPLLIYVRPLVLSKLFVLIFSVSYFVVMVFFSGNETYYRTVF